MEMMIKHYWIMYLNQTIYKVHTGERTRQVIFPKHINNLHRKNSGHLYTKSQPSLDSTSISTPTIHIYIYQAPLLGQDMTQGQF